jgi:dTDP-L-rhamnose 4-epimerase
VLVLVTGGLGFVGSHIVDALLADGADVRVLDVLHPLAHAEPPTYRRDQADERIADVADLDEAIDAVRGVDAVCHQAAMVGLGADFTDITAFTRDNDFGTAVLLRALHETGFAGPLVLASSMVVYGAGLARCEEHGVVDDLHREPKDLAAGDFEPRCRRCRRTLESLPVPETTALRPRNVYAATKVHQEHLCEAYALEHPDVALTMLRYHNVYGPRMPRDTPYAGVASLFRAELERASAPRVFEDGRQLRDFVHVHDVARANRLALERSAGPPLACNVASGDPHTVGDLAMALCTASGTGLEPEITGEWRAGDVRLIVGAPERADRGLGFRAEVRFPDGVREFATADLRAPVRAPRGMHA